MLIKGFGIFKEFPIYSLQNEFHWLVLFFAHGLCLFFNNSGNLWRNTFGTSNSISNSDFQLFFNCPIQWLLEISDSTYVDIGWSYWNFVFFLLAQNLREILSFNGTLHKLFESDRFAISYTILVSICLYLLFNEIFLILLAFSWMFCSNVLVSL